MAKTSLCGELQALMKNDMVVSHGNTLCQGSSPEFKFLRHPQTFEVASDR